MTRPLRVLHVIPAVADRYGGPSQTVVRLGRALAARGIEVTLASTDADGTGRLGVPLASMTEFGGLPAIFFERRHSESFKYAPGLSRWLHAGVTGYDVVHVHAVFSHASISAARSSWKRCVPYVLRPLGTLTPWAMSQKALRKRAITELVGRRMVRRAAAVHYTTLAERQLTEAVVGPTAGVVIPLGVDDAWVAGTLASAENRERVMLTVGRLHPVKNLEGVIAAFHQLAGTAEGADWRLVIAGEGEAEYQRRLVEAAAAGAGRDRIAFVGWLDEDAKREWLDRSAVLVQPSHLESFGVSIAEALARGVPAIVTPAVGLAADIADARAGWVSDPNSEALAATMRAVVTDAGAREKAGRAALALAAGFTWREAARRLESVYAKASERLGAPNGSGLPAADAVRAER